jgi:hypothetical protein
MTTLQDIADTLAECEFSDDTGERLLKQMREYRERSPQTLRRCMRVPGFAKLWLALDECAHLNCRAELDGDTR